MRFHRYDAPSKVKLDEISTEPPDGMKKHEAKERFDALNEELFDLQDLLWGARTHSVLMVLQGRDAAGKDGAVKHVVGALNPRGIAVTSFGVPTEQERRHDFLWRVHKRAPRAGEVAIFNRSHYEDVLVVRVRKLVPHSVWSKRYDLINDFEKILAQNGTRILKFFLHISREEQLARFAERLQDPARNWKISESDYTERDLWDDYIAAFQDAMEATSTKHAPWFVIPVNHKWARNLAVSRIVVESLEELDMAFPKPTVDLVDIARRYHAAVQEQLSHATRS